MRKQQLHLQSLGQWFKAADVVAYSGQEDVMVRWGTTKAIAESMAEGLELSIRNTAEGTIH